MQTAPDPYADDPLPDFAADLLSRVAEMVGAAGGVVRLDRGDGGGSQVLARYGRRAPRRRDDLLRVPLAVHRPYAGELELDAAPSGYAQPLAALVAERLSLHLENDRLRRADLRRQTWLTFLAEASELLAQSLDVELTMALIPQLVVPRLGQWCAVHTTDEWGRLQLAAATPRRRGGRCRSCTRCSPRPVRTRCWPGCGRRPGSARRCRSAPPMEGFAVPLVARGQRLGTLAVGRHQRHRHDAGRGRGAGGRGPPGGAGDRQRAHPRRAPQGRAHPAAVAAAAGAAGGRGHRLRRRVRADRRRGRGGRRLLRRRAAAGRPLAGGGRRRLRQGRAGGGGDRAGPGRDPGAGRRRQADARGRSPGSTRRWSSAAADATARWRWPRSAQRRDGQLDVALHLAGHDRPVLVRGDGRASFVGTGGTALGLLDTIAIPGRDGAAARRATR